MQQQSVYGYSAVKVLPLIYKNLKSAKLLALFLTERSDLVISPRLEVFRGCTPQGNLRAHIVAERV